MYEIEFIIIIIIFIILGLKLKTFFGTNDENEMNHFIMWKI